MKVGMRDLRTLSTRAGRDPDGFQISVYTWEPVRERARQYEGAGVARLIVQFAGLVEVPGTAQHFPDIAERVGLWVVKWAGAMHFGQDGLSNDGAFRGVSVLAPWGGDV